MIRKGRISAVTTDQEGFEFLVQGPREPVLRLTLEDAEHLREALDELISWHRRNILRVVTSVVSPDDAPEGYQRC